MVELARADIHRHDQPGGVRVPGPGHQLGAGGLERPAAQRQDQAGFLGQGNELGGEHDAAFRVLPAHERLRTDDAAGAVHLRLEIQQQVLVLQALAQVGFQPRPCGGHRLHFRIEEAQGVAARRLGAIHRQVGALHDVVHRVHLPLEQGDAEAGRAVILVAVQVVGDVQRGQDLFADGPGLDCGVRRVLAEPFQQHHELVTAQARHGVALANAGAEALGHLLQQQVATVMAQGVVEGLEVVEIDQDHRVRVRVAHAAGQHMLQAVEHEATVGQACQLVVEGQAIDLLFGGLAMADVGIDRQYRVRLGVFVAHQGAVAFEGDGAAVPAAQGHFARPVARLQQALGGDIDGGVVLVDQVSGRLAKGFFAGHAVEALGALVPVEDAVLHVVDDDGVLGLVQQRCLLAELPLAGAKHNEIALAFGGVGLHFPLDPPTVEHRGTDHHQHEHHDRVFDPAELFHRLQLLFQQPALDLADPLAHRGEGGQQHGVLPVHGRHAFTGFVRSALPEEGEDQRGFLHHLYHRGVHFGDFVLQREGVGLDVGAVFGLVGDPRLQLLPGHRQVPVEDVQRRGHVARFGLDVMGIEHVVAGSVDVRCQAAQGRVGRQLLDPGLVGLDGAVIGVDDQVVQQHAQHHDQHVEAGEEEVHAMPAGRARGMRLGGDRLVCGAFTVERVHFTISRQGPSGWNWIATLDTRTCSCA
ncbi:hypothetical protein D9M69_166320 [compost metagenome]